MVGGRDQDGGVPAGGRLAGPLRFWATADLASGEHEPAAILRIDESQWTVYGAMQPTGADWKVVDDALERWPMLRDFLDGPIGIEVSLISGEPTGLRMRPFGPDERVRVSPRVVDGSMRPRWVSRDVDGAWFVAEARAPMSEPALWHSAHGRHLVELFDELSCLEVVRLGPNESVEMTTEGSWILTRYME